MDAPKVQPPKEFKCELCGLTAPYTYYGPRPPNSHSVVFYTLPSRGQRRAISSSFSTSEQAKKPMDGARRRRQLKEDSSLFYSKRFCLPCVKENLKAFPLEIQEDMDKRKPQEKSCKKKDTKHKS